MAKGCLQLPVVRSLTLMVLLSCYGGDRRHANAMESPPYTVVLSAPDVEIRFYHVSLWMSAPVAGDTSFNKSTHDGFHRLYQYIRGANEDNAKLKITTPTLTTITKTSNGSNYSVSMYLPPKDDGGSIADPPIPSPQLNLHISNWKSHCIAVSTFSGFAQDDNVNKERSSLVLSLAKSFLFNGKNISVSEDKSSYSVAQYNASFHLTGRVNEAWINVSPCPSLR